MKRFLQKSWIALVVWAMVMAAAIYTMPDLGQLVREKGQVVIGDEYSYTIGKDIVKKMNGNSSKTGKELEIALLYRNPNKLTDLDKQKIKAKLAFLEENKAQYHINSMKNALSNTDLHDLLFSKDGTTLLVPVYIDNAGRSTEEIRSGLQKIMPVNGIEYYSTGADFVTEDFIKTTEAGIEKTEIITIIFIFLILLVIFKSPVTPIAVLSSIGLSFFVSLNVVLQLVKWVNFPLSNFTKVFLIIILFGIGTDYSLLLLMRYKEELSKTNDKLQAIINSYKTAGKTLLVSSLTILIGFTSLFFIHFQTYRSGTAVAIGVVILLLVLFSFFPGIMYLFGKTLFWSPFKNEVRSESKAWRKISSFSVKYPGVTVLLTLMVCGLILLYNSNLSFNNLKEVNPSYPSVQGEDVATKEFSIGLTLPVTIAVENNEKMDNQESLADIDKLTNIIKSIDGVKTVHSVTQPKGEILEQLYIDDQSKTLDNGLGDAESGLAEIHDGLTEAIDKIKNADYKKDSIGDLKQGTTDLITAISQVTKGGSDLLDGVQDSAAGSNDLVTGIGKLDTNLTSLSNSMGQLQSNYSQIAAGYANIDKQLLNINGSLSGIKTGLDGVVAMQTGLASYPYDVDHNGTIDPTEVLGSAALFQQMAGTTSQLDTGLGQVSGGLSQLEGGIATANGNLTQINQGLAQAQAGVAMIKAGADDLLAGGKDLQTGLTKIKNGQVTIVNALADIDSGAKELQDGQNQLISGINSIQTKMAELQNGLGDADHGVNKISTGLVDATDYLNGLADSKISGKTFYIPENEIYGDLFPRSMNIFFSPNKKVTEFIIILNVDPYSQDGMKVVNEINQTFSAAIKTTKLKKANWGISGITQMNVDLQTMSNKDFAFARIIMLASIFIVLLIITRDIWMTLFVSISLVASYFIAISLSGVFFKNVLNISQLSWNVPFFSFIMIITLGVDYSIFLIMRQKENKGLSSTDSIIEAASKVGSVIVSAGLILSGTFAAMYPSGVNTLMEVAVTVIIGIMLLCLLFIPVFIPTMHSLKSKILSKNSETEKTIGFSGDMQTQPKSIR